MTPGERVVGCSMLSGAGFRRVPPLWDLSRRILTHWYRRVVFFSVQAREGASHTFRPTWLVH